MGNIETGGTKPLQINVNGQSWNISLSQNGGDQQTEVEQTVEPTVEPKVEPEVEPEVELTGKSEVVIIDDVVDNVKLSDIDNYTVEQLIEYLKITRPEKKLVDNTFHDMVKNIDFENREIIPISIELYQKVKDVLFKYVAPVNKKKPKKKFHRYVAPKFNVEQIIKYNKINKETITDFLTLDPIPKPTIEFNTENITISEFDSAFKDPTLKIDMIGISKKMLQMLQQYHKLRIVNGYNKLWKGIIEPNFFGKVAYIFKENKPGATPTDIKFFRQIMVMPTIVKHFHRILTIRMANYIEKNNYIDTNIQKGGISVNSGCMQQIVKVKEVIKHANVNKKPACIMFLDLSNAYGNLNIDALTDIMGKYHMPDRMINYIKNYYKNFKYYAKSKIFDTKTLDWEGGLMQGCPMSSILFVLALNYILSHIDKKYKAECGYELENNSKFLLSAFVDDICIVANSMENLKKIYLDIKDKLDKLGLFLNLDKCAIMRINPTNDTTNIEVTSIENIPTVKVYKYLGGYISMDGTNSQSYSAFLSELGRNIARMDYKKATGEEKFSEFITYIVPWVRRQTNIMYDLTKDELIQITSIIRKSAKKWIGNYGQYEIFQSVNDILIKSNDNVIKKLDIITNVDIKHNTEFVNNLLVDSTVHIEYDEISKKNFITPIIQETQETQETAPTQVMSMMPIQEIAKPILA